MTKLLVLLLSGMLSASAIGQAGGQTPIAGSAGAVYGSRCGIVGADPPERIMIEELIEARNVVVISLWLRSKNPAIRVYAAEALIRLEKTGITISLADRSIIHRMRHSDEEVETCSGCLYLNERVRSVMTRIPGAD